MSTLELLGQISGALTTLRTNAESTAISAEQSFSRITTAADTARGSVGDVSTATEDIARQLDAFEKRAFDKLDSLRDRIKQFSGGWAEELKLQLAAVEAGAITVEDFLLKWGDAQVQTEEGSKRIRELLDGLNLGARKQEIQEFISGLQKGSIDLAAVEKFLAETGFSVAKQLADMIALFRQGKASIAQVASLIKSIEKQFAGSDLADLAQSLEQALLQGKP